MSFSINYEFCGTPFQALAIMYDAQSKYFQIMPNNDYPFFMRYDAKHKKWISVAGIFEVNAALVELVGKEIEKIITN